MPLALALTAEMIKEDGPRLMRGFAAGWQCGEIRDLDYWLREHGHRTVPLEIGGWKAGSAVVERLATIEKFVTEFVLPSSAKGQWTLEEAKLGEGEFSDERGEEQETNELRG